MKSGALRCGDVKWWWRPGMRHWISTGDISWLRKTLRLRIKLESLLKGCG